MNEDTMDLTQEAPIGEDTPVEQPEETQGEEQGESLENKPAKNDYSLFDFIKENGSVLFGCGTACVTILAGCMRFSSYLYHLAYWRHWNIDPALISSPENYWLENIALSFLLFVSGLMLLFAIHPIIQAMIFDKTRLKRLKEEHSESIKYINKYNERLKGFKKEKKEKEQFQRKTLVTLYDQEIAQLNNTIVSSSTMIEKGKNDHKKISKKIRALNRFINFRYLILLFSKVAIFILICSLSYPRNMRFLKSLGYSVVFIGFLVVVFYFVGMRSEKNAYQNYPMKKSKRNWIICIYRMYQ